MGRIFSIVVNLLPFLIVFCSSEKGVKHDEVLGLGEGALSTFNFFDDQLCLGNFDVSEGSIIRTKDSLALGARYINVSELGDGKAKDDCLRLCCKTQHCNVITFEEKRSGSCYMFDCGSIDNFLCKFTDQAEFMSAILRKGVEPITLQVQNPNRHEVELSQLRNSETEGRNTLGHSHTATDNEETIGKEKVASNFTFNLDKPDPLNGGSRRCSRYQFECKSSGECIGIYNACDGISQCPDGSDEAAELNCPSVNGRPGIVVKGTEPRQIGTQQKMSESIEGKNNGGSGGGSTSSLTAKSPQIQIHHSQELHSAVATHSKSAGSSNDEGQGQDVVVEKNGNVVVEIPLQAQANANNIFNHKDGGLMEDSYGNQLQQQQQQQAQRQSNLYNYWKSSYDYGLAEPPGMGYSPLQPVPQQGRSPPFYNTNAGGSPMNQPSNYGQFKYPAYGDIPPVPYNPHTQMFPPIVQQQPQYNTFPANAGSGSNKNQGSVSGDPAANSVQNSNRVESQNMPRIDTTSKPILTLTNATTTTPRTTTLSSSYLQPQTKVDPKEIDDKILTSLLNKVVSLPVPQSDTINYGTLPESDLPGPGAGAFLAFVAGLTMSVAMVVILTCRLRRVRMSSRRRGKNRLDPDYLVDGMYL